MSPGVESHSSATLILDNAQFWFWNSRHVATWPAIVGDKPAELRYVQVVCKISDVGPSLPALARGAIDYWLREASDLPLGGSVGPAAPVFVSLHHRATRQLRGCMGTLAAHEPDVRHETRRCAILAAMEDPRFEPLELSDMDGISIEVTVLCPLEVITGPEFLDPKRYGVVVSDTLGRRGVLLPELEGIDDVQTQLQIVRRKAGIAPGSPVDLQRFEALRFGEH